MKMTDADSAKDLCRRFDELVNAPSGGSQEEWSEWQCDAAAELLHVAARLAADQQKGGGEVGLPGSLITHRYVWRKALELAVFSADPAHAEKWNRELAAYDQTFDRLWQLIEAEMKWPDPQPSIPAPAQQDGKASGGEATDAMAEAMFAALNDPFNQWHTQIDRMKIAYRAAYLAHPPHADQETQG